MRPIKFRAWDKQRRIWLDPNKYFFYLNGELDSFSLCDESGNFDIDNYVLQQYTGMKDKNGNEIWEGDICQVEIWFGEIWSYGKLLIKFRDGMFGYELYAGSGDWQMMELDGREEVLGNILEHKHLLEEK